MKKNRLFEDDWKQCNEEAKMAKMQLKNIQANVADLLDKIESCEELDAWVQSYLTKADDYLDSVKKYVVFGQDEDTTVLEPTEVTPGAKPAVPPTGVPEVPSPMPPIDGYDPDAEEEPAEDLTPEPEVEEEPEMEPEMEPGDEEAIPDEEIEDIEGEEDMEDEDFPEDVEDMEDETENMGDEELPDEEEIEYPEDGEEAIEEPEELDLDDDQFKMPSIGNFEIGGGEAISGMEMPKPDEEDELSMEDIEFFQGQKEEPEVEEVK